MAKKSKASLITAPFGAVSTVRNFVDVIRELSVDEIRQAAEQMPQLLILAADAAQANAIGERLVGVNSTAAVTAGLLSDPDRDFQRYDVVVVFDRDSGGSFARIRDRAGASASHVFDLATFDEGDESGVDRLRGRITGQLPELAPALGRWFAPFRPAASKTVIDETSRVNAQFALISNAPAVIPILGSLAAVGADFIVITKNQLLMIYKLAAISGRDLRDHWTIMREMIPVVGAGLAWRTVAREASAMVPFAAGTIPKVAIAYTGTMAAGWAADFYFKFGEKPNKLQWKTYYQQALDGVKKLELPSRTPKPSVDEAIILSSGSDDARPAA